MLLSDHLCLISNRLGWGRAVRWRHIRFCLQTSAVKSKTSRHTTGDLKHGCHFNVIMYVTCLCEDHLKSLPNFLLHDWSIPRTTHCRLLPRFARTLTQYYCICWIWHSHCFKAPCIKLSVPRRKTQSVFIPSGTISAGLDFVNALSFTFITVYTTIIH